ncbi:MAG: hypothetical protein CSA55_05100 [Ilumatobacter coccineus]|uniref:GH18 domain-containing protein n=1 Tax=Ilumatobacter coccineus TaxID=467094 RepID=A0A2G6K8N6_9ACTN|nr:MAG: hypothetical protein CSA55_05100 [Ilumatobacter coccineus]
MNLPAAVLWDFDGTLVDTEPYWFEAEYELIAEFGHRWTDDDAQTVVGWDLLDVASYMKKRGGIDLPAHEIVERLLDGVIARLAERIPWRPGARKLLMETRRAGIPCALVTMSWRRMIEPVLAELPPNTFATTISGDEVPEGRGKPDPTPYLMAAEACGADPRRCVAIEDSPTGARSAADSGCQVLAVANIVRPEPGPRITFASSLADVTLSDLRRLVARPRSPRPSRPSASSRSVRHSRPPGMGRPQRPPEAQRSNGSRPVQPPKQPSRPTSPLDSPIFRIGAALVTAVAMVAAAFLLRSDPPSRPVTINAWVPYWSLDSSLPSADAKLKMLDEVSPFWFGVHGVDDIRVDQYADVDSTTAFIDRVRASGTKLVPALTDETGPGKMAAILADPNTRDAHIDALVRFAAEIKADGLDLDYETFAFGDDRSTWESTRPHWVAFVDELASRLHDDGRTLTVTIPPIWGGAGDQPSGYWVYDHAAMTTTADQVRIMAYDYSVDSVGPIAPLSWVTDIVTTVGDTVAPDQRRKLVLGIPSYGTNWVTSTSGTCPDDVEGRLPVNSRSVHDLIERRDVTPTYDATTAEWSFSYSLTVTDSTTSCIQERSVVWVDAEGVAARVAAARQGGWGGVALWALGYDSDAVWTSLLASSGTIPTTTPVTE